MRTSLAILLLLVPLGARAERHADGVAAGVSIELTPMSLGGSPTTANPEFLPLPTTHVFGGYQTGALTIGLQLDVDRYSESNGGQNASLTTAFIGPSARAVLVASETGATELAAAVDLGYRTFSESSSGGMPPDLGHVLVAHVGPSIRHWVGPHFALAATAAARIDEFAPPSSANTAASWAVALGYSFDLLGVF